MKGGSPCIISLVSHRSEKDRDTRFSQAATHLPSLLPSLPASLPPSLPPSLLGHITNAMGNGLVNVQTMPGDLYVGHLEDVRPDLEGR